MKGVVIGISSTLNVRSGPSTSHTRVGTLTNNAPLDIFEYRDGWFRIRSGSQEGWVFERYVRLLDLSTPVPGADPAALKALQDEIVSLKSKITALQSQINTAAQNTAKDKQELDALKSRLSGYQTRLRAFASLLEEVK